MANDGQFVESLTSSQNRLWGYIHSLTGDLSVTEDVLQDTNRKLWQVRDQYDTGRPFIPWAFKVAFNQVRAARKKSERDRLVFQDQETLQVLADDYVVWQERLDDRALALETCIGQLGKDQQKLLRDHYGGGVSVKALAESMQRQANSVAVALHRVRQTLAKCIKGKVR